MIDQVNTTSGNAELQPKTANLRDSLPTIGRSFRRQSVTPLRSLSVKELRVSLANPNAANGKANGKVDVDFSCLGVDLATPEQTLPVPNEEPLCSSDTKAADKATQANSEKRQKRRSVFRSKSVEQLVLPKAFLSGRKRSNGTKGFAPVGDDDEDTGILLQFPDPEWPEDQCHHRDELKFPVSTWLDERPVEVNKHSTKTDRADEMKQEPTNKSLEAFANQDMLHMRFASISNPMERPKPTLSRSKSMGGSDFMVRPKAMVHLPNASVFVAKGMQTVVNSVAKVDSGTSEAPTLSKRPVQRSKSATGLSLSLIRPNAKDDATRNSRNRLRRSSSGMKDGLAVSTTSRIRERNSCTPMRKRASSRGPAMTDISTPSVTEGRLTRTLSGISMRSKSPTASISGSQENRTPSKRSGSRRRSGTSLSLGRTHSRRRSSKISLPRGSKRRGKEEDDISEMSVSVSMSCSSSPSHQPSNQQELEISASQNYCRSRSTQEIPSTLSVVSTGIDKDDVTECTGSTQTETVIGEDSIAASTTKEGQSKLPECSVDKSCNNWLCCCGSEMEDRNVFCGHCGIKRFWVCGACNHDRNSNKYVFCGMCGTSKS